MFGVGAMVGGLDTLDVDLSVVLGKTAMPLHELLKLGRGAVVELATGDGEEVELLANGHLIARGRAAVRQGRIAVEVTALVTKPTVTRQPGARIGGSDAVAARPAAAA